MKIITLKSLPKPVFVVELPQEDVDRKPYGFDQTHIFAGEDPIVYHLRYGDKEDSTRAFNLGSGVFVNYIGHFPSITEEQFEGLVEREEFVTGHRSLGFRNYNGSRYDWFGTARESFISAIEAEVGVDKINLKNLYVFKKI